jgi:hypothetical protein
MIYQMLSGRLPFDAGQAGRGHSAAAGAERRQVGSPAGRLRGQRRRRPGSVSELLDRLEHASGPSEAELAAQKGANARSSKKGRKPKEQAARAAARSRRGGAQRRTQEAAAQGAPKPEAKAAAQAERWTGAAEQEKLARLAAEEARRVRKEELAAPAGGAAPSSNRKRRARKPRRQRAKLAQAKAAAAYLAQQQRARAEQAARNQAELEVADADPGQPGGRPRRRAARPLPGWRRQGPGTGAAADRALPDGLTRARAQDRDGGRLAEGLAGARAAAALGRHREADRDGPLSGDGGRMARFRARDRLAPERRSELGSAGLPADRRASGGRRQLV